MNEQIDFEDALDDLILEWRDKPKPDKIISALEISLMALKEDAAGQEDNDNG